MNRNVMIVLAGGFLVAVLVALLVQASLSGGKKQEAPVIKEEPKVQIIVAAEDLKTGMALSETNMKWQDWPKGAIFPGAVVREGDKKPEEMLSGRLRRDVKVGEPIVETALVAVAKGNFLAASLDEGMRAYAINANAASLAGGFIGPGDFVDVILTYRSSIQYEGKNAQIEQMIEKNLDHLATETILQNIRVLAVDQSAMRPEDDKIKVGKTVTLEVDYKGAEILALASQLGDISLSLRRLGDENRVTQLGPVTTDARTTRIYDEVYDQINQMQDNAGQQAKVVRIYRGEMFEDISVSP